VSLINQMLKDLEQRRAQSNKQPNDVDISKLISPEEPQQLKKSSGFRRLIIPASIVFVLMFLFAFLAAKKYFAASGSGKAEKQVQPSMTIAKAPTKKVSSEPVASKPVVSKSITKEKPSSKEDTPSLKISLVEPAVAQKININIEDHKTILQLDLNNDVHYQFNVSDDEGTLTLKLDNTTLKQPVPAVSDDAAITKIQTQQSANGNLQLDISVRPDTQVLDLNQNKETKVLTLTLLNKNYPDEQQEKEAKKEEMKKVEVPLTAQQIADKSYKKALELVEQNHLNQAIDQLETLLTESPDFLLARKTLVILLIEQHRFGAAKVFLQEGLRQTPRSAALVKLYAQILASEGNNREALLVLQQASPSLEQDPDYYALMAALQQRLGNPRMAAQLYQQLLRVHVDNPTWWMGVGIALETTKQFNGALQAYKRAAITGTLEPNLQAFVEAKIHQLSGM